MATCLCVFLYSLKEVKTKIASGISIFAMLI